MAAHAFATQTGRLNKFAGEIIGHAIAQECISRGGRQVRYDKNKSDTYVARSWVPWNSTAASPNTFFGATTLIDRGNAIVTAHQTAEGITPTPDSMQARDVTVVMQQYSCLYGWTDKTASLYEDKIPEQAKIQAGERVTLVNEMICFGALKACTNVFFGGTGTSRATVNGALSLPMLRRISASLMRNHGKPVSRVLAASGDFDTTAVPQGFIVYCSTDLEASIRDLPNFNPAEKYASGKPMDNEIGMCERFRFVTSPEFVQILDGASSVNAGTFGLQTTGGTNPDVYQFIVTAADAWSQIAVRGLDALMPTYLPTGVPSKADPFGQRGYAGAMWWKAVMIENNGWMAVGNVAIPA